MVKTLLDFVMSRGAISSNGSLVDPSSIVGARQEQRLHARLVGLHHTDRRLQCSRPVRYHYNGLPRMPGITMKSTQMIVKGQYIFVYSRNNLTNHLARMLMCHRLKYHQRSQFSSCIREDE